MEAASRTVLWGVQERWPSVLKCILVVLVEQPDCHVCPSSMDHGAAMERVLYLVQVGFCDIFFLERLNRS